MSLNSVTLLCRLGKDPSLAYTPTAVAVCKFSVATSEDWTDKEGKKQQKVEWHNIVIFGKQAESCAKYLSKGSQALIIGKLQTRTWDDQEGKKCYMTEINAQNVQFIGGAQSKQEEKGKYDDISF